MIKNVSKIKNITERKTATSAAIKHSTYVN